VTQREFERVMGTNPSLFTKDQRGGPGYPVEQVSWDEAAEFCRRLSLLLEERKAGHRYTLPTEAEWEYACRAGTVTPFAFGHNLGLSSTQANFDGTRPYGSAEVGPYLERTSKVGSYPANAWGLYDMHGNVWEWCQDWYAEGYDLASEVDPTGPVHGSQRVLRGGSWNNSGFICRSARRNKYAPDFRNSNIGFRVALRVV
jgi:formylglycine-generating enzyme